jgi:type IV secretion system protein VirD4
MTQRGVMLGSLNGYYLTDDADTHLMLCGPTSSGKDVAHVIPTAHLWRESVLITDPKGGVTYQMTARYRQGFSDLRVFAPLDQGSIKLNVLDTIRKGTTYAFRDAQSIAKSLTAPEQMVRETPVSLHFRELATVLLTGSILHTVYTSPRPSLAGVLEFLTVEHDALTDCLDVLVKSPHLTGEEQTLVSSIGKEIAQVRDRELSGVWTTTMRGLHLYREPTVARNTDTSDMDLNALQYSDRPITLYLVAPSPEELHDYHPLYRVVVETILRQLTMHDVQTYRHRLLILANEFPSYGYMPRIETGAATLRDYGIKLCLIAQDLEQFWGTYGKDTPLWGNLHIKAFHTPENDLTAKRISENMLDTMTIEREVVSYQGWTKRRGTTSTQQHARQLMTTGEVMKMSQEDLLLFVGGYPPFKAKKVRWHADPIFKARVRPCGE